MIETTLLEWRNVIGWLLVATYARFVLGWSFEKIFKVVSEEMRDTARLRPTPAGINGMSIVSITTIALLTYFAPTLGKLAGIVNDAPSEMFDLNLVFVCITAVFVTSLFLVMKSK